MDLRFDIGRFDSGADAPEFHAARHGVSAALRNGEGRGRPTAVAAE